MPYPLFNAGQRLTAGLLTGMQTHTVQQGTDMPVTNSTTFFDSNLKVPVAAGGIYLIKVRAAYTGAATADMQIKWTGPAGAVIEVFASGTATGSTPAGGLDDRQVRPLGYARTYGADPAIGWAHMYEDCLATVGGTAGTYTLQMTQAAASATPTILRAVSYLEYLRVG